MSHLSILCNPGDIGLTSCLKKPPVDLMELDELHEMLHTLRKCHISTINDVAKNGRLFLNKAVNTRQGYNNEYHVNNSWKLAIHRISKDVYVFALKPVTITAISSFKNGLNKIAQQHMYNNVDSDVWVRYEHMSKIFYLKEFAVLINNKALVEACKIYTPLFSKNDYLKWADEYGWPYLGMNYTYRKYITQHVNIHIKKLKAINKRK